MVCRAGKPARGSKVLKKALGDKHHPSLGLPSRSPSWALNKYLLRAHECCPPLLPDEVTHLPPTLK